MKLTRRQLKLIVERYLFEQEETEEDAPEEDVPEDCGAVDVVPPVW